MAGGVSGEQNCVWDDLKDDEIRAIFQCLELPDRGALSLANKRSWEIFKTVRSWSLRKEKKGRIKGLVDCIPVIKDLLVDCADNECIGLLAATHPELSSLDLNFQTMAEDIRMKAKFPMLKHLRVAGLVNFPIQLGRLKAEVLESLEIFYSMPVNFRKFVERHPNLVRLKLHDVYQGYSGERIRILEHICKHLEELEELDLSENRDVLDDSCVEQLASSPLSSTLKLLNLSVTVFQIDLSPLPEFTNLHTLKVSRNAIYDKELLKMKKKEYFLPNIRVIDFSDNAITDVGVEALLEVFPNLEEIDISWNPSLTNRSMETISSQVENLRELIVKGTRVTDEGVKLLRTCQKLTFLHCNFIDYETFILLQAASPNLVVEQYGVKTDDDVDEDDDYDALEFDDYDDCDDDDFDSGGEEDYDHEYDEPENFF